MVIYGGTTIYRDILSHQIKDYGVRNPAYLTSTLQVT